MTNEEAIAFGQMWLDMNEDAKDTNTYEFFVKAITALSQAEIKPESITDEKKCETCTYHTDTDEIHGYTPCGTCGITKNNYKADKKKMQDITELERKIEAKAYKRDLTFAKNYNGHAYALMDIDWIGYFDTIDEICEFLEIDI